MIALFVYFLTGPLYEPVPAVEKPVEAAETAEVASVEQIPQPARPPLPVDSTPPFVAAPAPAVESVKIDKIAPQPAASKPVPKPIEAESAEEPLPAQAGDEQVEEPAPLQPVAVEAAPEEPATSEPKPVVAGYVKIGINGERLPDSAEQWSCVEDLATGLVWEIKSAEPGLHNTNNLYSWYEPSVKGKVAGIANGGRCEGTACDTHAYIQVLSQKNYCGYADWRLPSREEFLSLVSMGEVTGAATIDRTYFPHALPSWYWTATSHEQHPEYAWYLLFRNGITLSDVKDRAKHLRLVRSDGQTG